MCNLPINDKNHNWLTNLDTFVWIKEEKLDWFELSLIEQSQTFEIIDWVLCKKEEILGN